MPQKKSKIVPKMVPKRFQDKAKKVITTGPKRDT